MRQSVSLLGLVLLLFALAGALQAPTAIAYIVKSPSGIYHSLVNGRLLHYDNVYDTVTDLGPSPDSYECPWIGSSDQAQQCGQCVYVGGEGWRSSSTQYSQGRCVSIDGADPAGITYRGDVRIISDVMDHWNYTAYAKYFKNAGNQQVGPPRDILLARDCINTRINTAAFKGDIAYCAVLPETVDIRQQLTRYGADYYCVFSETYSSADVNVEPDSSAWVCP